jgi:ATP adenylyltransferase
MQLWLADAVARAVVHARAKGAIFGIETTSTVVLDHGFPFLVRIVSSLRDKPVNEQGESAASSEEPPGPVDAADGALGLAERAATSHVELGVFPDPFLPYEEDLYVGDVPPAHVCLLNKFNVVEGHLLVVTRAFREQTHLLDSGDCTAIWHCLRQYPGLGFYNSGKVAGASQRHKHLQLIPLAGVEAVPIHEKVEEAARSREEQTGCFVVPALPFKHAIIGMHDLYSESKSDAEIGAAMHSRYMQLLHFTIEELGVPASSWMAWEARSHHPPASAVGHPANDSETAHPFPYNLLLTSNWMMLVPRRHEKFLGDISVNALGFAGFLLAKNESQRDLIVKHGPLKVLAQVGIPWNH